MNGTFASPPACRGDAPEPALCKAFVATSLDGFIARPDGAIDWLEAANRHMPAGEDCGWHEYLAGIDALVMGRATFEQVLRFAQWPYAGTPVVVASRSALQVPAALRFAVQVSAESPQALVQRLVRQGRRRLGVDGGRLINAFLRAGLIDEVTVTTVPVLIGSGRRLFDPPSVDADVAGVAADVHLAHITTRSWPFGFVQSTWHVRRCEPPPDHLESMRPTQSPET